MSRLLDAGEKNVKQRTAIVEAFFAFGAQVTAPDLRDRVRGRGQAVSLTTVQRTLIKLVQHGLAVHRRHGRQLARFSPVISPADHGRLICTACRSIIPFTDQRVETLHETIARRRRFEIRAHKLEIYGICEQCRGRDALE